MELWCYLNWGDQGVLGLRGNLLSIAIAMEVAMKVEEGENTLQPTRHRPCCRFVPRQVLENITLATSRSSLCLSIQRRQTQRTEVRRRRRFRGLAVQ